MISMYEAWLDFIEGEVVYLSDNKSVRAHWLHIRKNPEMSESDGAFTLSIAG